MRLKISPTNVTRLSQAKGPKGANPKLSISEIVSDKSTIILLLSNIVTIFFAVSMNWSLVLVMWSYWIQSVVIGIFNFWRIWNLKDFSTKGFRINNRAVEPTKETKNFTAVFFAFHYGFFHFVYAIFLAGFSLAEVFEGGNIVGLDIALVLISGLIFFVGHRYSFKHNEDKGRKKHNIGTLMFFPYVRIIPMHLTIIGGAMLGGGAIIMFLALKTGADLVMHVIEHRLFK